MAKSIILCADDFGLNSGVSAGILQLASMQRVSAVSCMVNLPDCSVSAAKLLTYKNHIQIGLHFNLTEGELLSRPGKKCFSLNELLLKTHLGLIDSALITNEFNAQLDRFVQLMGFLPDFIDGHQHIHQLPQVRQTLLKLCNQRLKGVFVRSTFPSNALPEYQFKAKILAFLGGKHLHRQLKQVQIPCNEFFAGVYDFKPNTNYRSLFRRWLAQANDHTLIMCHPGESCASEDVIGAARVKELDYFLSDAFQSDCDEYAVHLATGPVTRQGEVINCD